MSIYSEDLTGTTVEKKERGDEMSKAVEAVRNISSNNVNVRPHPSALKVGQIVKVGHDPRQWDYLILEMSEEPAQNGCDIELYCAKKDETFFVEPKEISEIVVDTGESYE